MNTSTNTATNNTTTTTTRNYDLNDVVFPHMGIKMSYIEKYGTIQEKVRFSLEMDYISNECDEGIKLYWYETYYENYYDDISATNTVFHGSVLDKMEVLEDLRKARDKIKKQEREYNELENKYFDLQDERLDLEKENDKLRKENERLRFKNERLRKINDELRNSNTQE